MARASGSRPPFPQGLRRRLHTHTHEDMNTCQKNCLNQIDDSPLTLALHSLTRHFIISRFLLRTAIARGDSPCLVTGAVVSE